MQSLLWKHYLCPASSLLGTLNHCLLYRDNFVGFFGYSTCFLEVFLNSSVALIILHMIFKYLFIVMLSSNPSTGSLTVQKMHNLSLFFLNHCTNQLLFLILVLSHNLYFSEKFKTVDPSLVSHNLETSKYNNLDWFPNVFEFMNICSRNLVLFVYLRKLNKLSYLCNKLMSIWNLNY